MDKELQKIKEHTENLRVVVFSGFSELDYEDTHAVDTKIAAILRQEAESAGGFDKIIAVAGATEPGIGRMYKIAARLGIKTLGIVSNAALGMETAPDCNSVVYIADPEQKWKVLDLNGRSYMVLAAGDNNSAFYALGGGKVTFSELEQALQQGIRVYPYEYAPSPEKVEERRQKDLAKGVIEKTYTPVNDWIKENTALQRAMTASALPEHMQAAYKSEVPGLKVDPGNSEPVLYNDKHYIRIGIHDYPVRFDSDSATWRIYAADNANKPPLPVRYRDGQWQLHNDVGMGGGAPGNLSDALRAVYQASLPTLSEEIRKEPGFSHSGRNYVRIGEDHYEARRTPEWKWAIYSQSDDTAKPLPLVFKNNQWQLALITNDIDATFNTFNNFNDFSENAHFRRWFHTAINTLSLLGARYPHDTVKPAITASQQQSLIKFILKQFQMQATYSLEDTATAIHHASSPLVTEGTYSREQTALFKLLRHIKTEELQSRLITLQRTTGMTYQPPGFSLEREFHIFPVSVPFVVQNTGTVEVFDDIPPNLHEKTTVYISKSGVMLFNKSQYSSEENIERLLTQKGARMSQNEVAEILSRKMMQQIEAGRIDQIRESLTDFFFYKEYDSLGDSFNLVELSPNGLLVPISTDPLTQTGRPELIAMEEIYRQCRDVDKSLLPFYVKQNMEVLQNLVGANASSLFTRNTPAMITAEFTDMLQTTYDLMVKINNERDPVRNSVNMEKFYHTVQNLHHLIRFQMNWNGLDVNLEETIRQLLPADIRHSAYVMSGPHGLSVIDQVSKALPHEFHQESAYVKRMYFETPRLFRQAKKVASIFDSVLRTQKLIVMEPHPNDISQPHIAWQDPVALLRNVFSGPVMQRTFVLDVTTSHLNEAEITNLLAEAKPYIDNGHLNLVLVQSGTKLFQNGMDIVSMGTAVILNNNTGPWSLFNDIMRSTQQYVPAEDKTYIARMLSAQNMPLMQGYLDKIRSNTRLIRTLLEPALTFGHNNDNVFQLTINTDDNTVYITLRPTDHFIALQTQEKEISSITEIDRRSVNVALKFYLLNAFTGLPVTERPSFGFNVSNISPALDSIRIAIGIEDKELIEEYARRILKMGKTLYDQGVIQDYLPTVQGNLGDFVDPSDEKWMWDASKLLRLEEEITKKLNTPTPGQDTDESLWIIQLQGDDTTSDVTRAFLLRYAGENTEAIHLQPNQSVITHSLKWDNQRQSLVPGVISPPKKNLKLLIIGHGADEGGQKTFGGRSIDSLKNDLLKILSKISKNSAEQIDVELVGSQLADINAMENSLPAVLAAVLLEEGRKLGINPDRLTLSASQYDVRVMPDGTKKMHIRGEGWVSEGAIAADREPLSVWLYNDSTGTMLPAVSLPQHIQAAYRIQIPGLTVAPGSSKPIFHNDSHYIHIGSNDYPVRFDNTHGTWRIYAADNPNKPSLPVHYHNGQWQLHNNVGMGGGAPTQGSESLPTVYGTESALSGIPSTRMKTFQELISTIYYGHTFFHGLRSEEKRLLYRFLDTEQIDALSTRSEEGRVIYDTLQRMPANTTDILEGMAASQGALASTLDADSEILAEVALKLKIDPSNQSKNNLAGREILNAMQQQSGNINTTADRYTINALGLRARVLYALQMSSNGVLILGAAAALCRIYVINRRLEDKTLSETEKSTLLVEKNVAIAELSVDLTQEFSEFINSKFGIQLSPLPAGSVNLSASSGLKIGARMTQGLRLFGISAASTALTAVGTAFAWYGVITAARELQKLSSSTGAADNREIQAKITQLQVNIGVNIVTTLVSTVLTVGTVVSLVTGIAAALGIAGAASVSTAAAAFMSVASPVGGAILVAAFVGLWIYNGIKTVEEFSRHIDLNGWDKFALGFGSIFGHVLPHLQIKYDTEKLQSAVKKAAGLEKSGLLESLPEVRALYQFRAEVIPGREIEHRRETTGWFDGQEFPTTEVIRRESIPAIADYRAIDINPDDNWYLSVSSVDSSNQKQLSADDFIHIRQGKEEVKSDKGYHQGAFLTLQGRRVELPNSAFGQNNQNLDGAAVSAKLNAAFPQALKDILSSQPQSRLYAADEATHLALFCIHEQDKKISFFKFKQSAHPPGAGDRYALEFSDTQDLPAGLNLQNARAVLFHDLDGNSLADLVVIHEDGSLAVALQRRNGNFVLTQDFSLYRVDDGEILSFPWYDGIHGFGGTARTLYSHSSGGTRYSHAILSLAERKAMASLVNLNRGTGEADGKFDNFITSAKADSGDFLFHLGGGREKRVKGGKGNDSFVLLDEKTFCKLKGDEGSDTLNFSRLSEKTVSGVRIDAATKVGDWEGQASLKLSGGTTELRMFFSGMENFTGTRQDDDITGDNRNNVIDGVDGQDTLDGGAGNDILRGVRGKFTGGSGTDSFQLRRLPSGSSDPVLLIEDYRLGEDSHVSLEYDINEIESIAPEDGKHLLINLTGDKKYRLKDFYANAHARVDKKTSAWYISTRDGFSFRLKTAAALPTGTPAHIPAFFQSTLKPEEQELISIHLRAREGNNAARVDINEIVAGHPVQRTINLPLLFSLEGAGTHRYWLRRKSSEGTVELAEDYRAGENSHVSLGWRIDEIISITVEESRHLLLTLAGGIKYRLRNFYAHTHASTDKKAPAWYFTTEDGFSFQLETAAAPPVGVTTLKDIPVFFQGVPETQGTGVYLTAGGERASVSIYETVANQDVQRTILLPALFRLELRSPAGKHFVQITGQHRAERLTGRAGSRLTGNGGADIYLIEDSPGDTVEINNEDNSPVPATDTLIVPWALPETALSVRGNDVRLSHIRSPGSHVKVNLFWFMSEMKFRHLMLRDAAGPAYRLEVTDGKAWLASSPLLMNREDRLELLTASGGGLTLDGRSRYLSEDNSLATIIIDDSRQGNSLAGTENARNHLRVSGGRNNLYGGRLADALYGGTGYDYMSGGNGDDIYHVSGSATLDDTEGKDTLILAGTKGTAQEELWLEKTQDGSLLIRFRSDESRTVTVRGHYNNPGKRIEHIVVDEVQLSHDAISLLTHAMASIPLFTDLRAMQSNPLIAAALDGWRSTLTTISVA